jgi:uncharacterized protein YgiM (DUF1202 family)
MNQKQKVMKNLLVILISAVSFNGMAQDNPKYLNVLAVNGLNIRSQPDSKSRIVTKVQYGKQVEIIQKTKAVLQLGWVKDNWYRVKYRGREGFIFGGYLSEFSAPNGLESVKYLSDLLPVYCSNAFKKDGPPVTTEEKVNSNKKLVHTLIRYDGGHDLEMELEGYRRMSKLLLNQTVAETYVLLESILKQSGNAMLMDELRFIKGKNGSLKRINTADGTISIRELSVDITELKLVSFTSNTTVHSTM